MQEKEYTIQTKQDKNKSWYWVVDSPYPSRWWGLCETGFATASEAKERWKEVKDALVE